MIQYFKHHLGDWVWTVLLGGIVLFFSIPYTRMVYLSFSVSAPYPAGFFKFAVLASMGELLSQRIKAGYWCFSKESVPRFFVWGIFGVIITFMFIFYSGAVSSMQESGVLPGKSNTVITAFLISAIMNLTFGPAFMVLHRLSDEFIDQVMRGSGFSSDSVLEKVAWTPFLRRIIKSILLFWIPAHTVTFLLPSRFRVLSAAFLSIILGIILTFSGGHKNE